MKQESWKRAQESFNIEAEAIKITSGSIDKAAFEKAVDMLAKSIIQYLKMFLFTKNIIQIILKF